ncbi:MAG: hypothetical protein AAFX78_18895 [Cyanobacteria bacterium J06638_20]
MKNQVLITKKDVKLAYQAASTSLKSYLERQVKGKRMSPAAANAQYHALQEGWRIMLFLVETGLSVAIVKEWIEAEMKLMEKELEEKGGG